MAPLWSRFANVTAADSPNDLPSVGATVRSEHLRHPVMLIWSMWSYRLRLLKNEGHVLMLFQPPPAGNETIRLMTLAAIVHTAHPSALLVQWYSGVCSRDRRSKCQPVRVQQGRSAIWHLWGLDILKQSISNSCMRDWWLMGHSVKEIAPPPNSPEFRGSMLPAASTY